jgi:cell division protein ZapA (FtsZ GTPase activity inhibitor)
MSNDDNQDRERAVKDRIAEFFEADEQAQRRRATNEELQSLKNAVGRLEQLLTDTATDEQTQRKRVTDEEAQALRAAATRLDQLLTDISGKEGTAGSKVRHQPNKDKTG